MSEHGSWGFTVQLKTDPHVIRAVRKVIAATARIGGARDADARLIELSVGEALANARFHAYQGGVGPIEATVMLDGEMFSVTIQNEGKPVTRCSQVPDTLDPPEVGKRSIAKELGEVRCLFWHGLSSGLSRVGWRRW